MQKHKKKLILKDMKKKMKFTIKINYIPKNKPKVITLNKIFTPIDLRDFQLLNKNESHNNII